MIDTEKLTHDLAIVSLSQRLSVEFKGKTLDEKQVHVLYQECFDNVLSVINKGGLD